MNGQCLRLFTSTGCVRAVRRGLSRTSLGQGKTKAKFIEGIGCSGKVARRRTEGKAAH